METLTMPTITLDEALSAVRELSNTDTLQRQEAARVLGIYLRQRMHEALRRAGRSGDDVIGDDRRREGYELALEGLRIVLSVTPPDDNDRADLMVAYRAFAELAGRSILTCVRGRILGGQDIGNGTG